MLRRAADHFVNEGCNEYHLMGEGGLDDDEVVEILALLTANARSSPSTSPVVDDWLLMRALASEMDGGAPRPRTT